MNNAAYDHPGLTRLQRLCRTQRTLGKEVSMNNGKASGKAARFAVWLTKSVATKKEKPHA